MAIQQIEELQKAQDSMLQDQQSSQNRAVDLQTQLNVDALTREKAKVGEEATKTNAALYSNYIQQSNPFGVKAEEIVGRGLGNTGYAESSKVSMYNTFQKAATETINTATKVKAEFDVNMGVARTQGDILKAQNEAALYSIKMQNLYQNYQLKTAAEQFDYQKSQDQISQANWEKTYLENQKQAALSQQNWDKSFNYGVTQDQLAQQNWEKEYQLSKKASSGRSNYVRSNYQPQTSIVDVNQNGVDDRDEVGLNATSGTAKKMSFQDMINKVKTDQFNRETSWVEEKYAAGKISEKDLKDRIRLIATKYI